MSRLPRAICPLCYREVPVRVNGSFREHRLWDGGLCPAAGRHPDEIPSAEYGIATRRRQLKRLAAKGPL